MSVRCKTGGGWPKELFEFRIPFYLSVALICIGNVRCLPLVTRELVDGEGTRAL